MQLDDTNRSRASFQEVLRTSKEIGNSLTKSCSVQLSGCQSIRKISGDDGEGVPPVPMPNTEVKPFSAESTWLETAREDRSSPDSN